MTATLAVQNTGEAAVFWVCAVLAVLGALGMLFSRKAVHSALFLAMTMVNLAILYVSLQAPFLGMVQIIVYTGAIMMLFLFVLMVVGVDSSDSLVETVKGQRPAAILFGLGFAVLLIGLARMLLRSVGWGRHAPLFPEAPQAAVLPEDLPIAVAAIAGAPGKGGRDLPIAMRAVLESVGVTDVLAKSKGSSNPHNVVKATIEALVSMRDANAVSRQRGIKLERVFNG